MAFVDIHTHILPGFDDGAKDLEVSRALLTTLVEQGVGTVVATPHFYPNREDLGTFVRRRQIAVDKLLSLEGMSVYRGAADRAGVGAGAGAGASLVRYSPVGLSSAGQDTPEVGLAVDEFAADELPAVEKPTSGQQSISREQSIVIYLGAEVALSSVLLRYETLEPLQIGRNRHILIEMPFSERWSSDTFQLLEQIVYKHHLRPIIAHIERYPATKNGQDTSSIQTLVDIGCLIQMNVSSLQDFRERYYCKNLLKGGWINLLGSDCHNMVKRPPRFDLYNKYAPKWGINEHSFKISFE